MTDLTGAIPVIRELRGVIDEIFTSDEERAEARRLLYALENEPHRLQAEITKTEAAHSSVFVSGWRPFIGWVCGAGVAYHYVLRDLIAWGFAAYGLDLQPLPHIELSELLGLLVAMMGLGAGRTLERLSGVQRERIKP